MAIEKEIRIKGNTKDADDKIKKTNEGLKNMTDSTDEFKEASTEAFSQLDSLTGGAISKFKTFKGSLSSVSTGFKGIGKAIALSGLGLIVLTISAVVTAFKSSEEGQNKFAKLMGIIGTITGNVMDLVADFGEMVISVFENPKEAITNLGKSIKDNIVNRLEGLIEFLPSVGKAINKVFKGEFSEAGEIMVNASSKMVLGVENVTDKVKEATKAVGEFYKENLKEAEISAKIADDRAKADKIERALLIERATLENDIAELRLKARQENSVSAEERRKSLIDAQKLEDGLLEKETEVLKLRSDAITLENTLSRSTKEDLDEEAKAKAELIKQEARRTNSARQTQRELTRVENEIESDRKSRAKEAEARRKAQEKAEQDRLKKLSDFENKIITKNEDLENKTAEDKLKLSKDRDQKELDNLKATNEEKKKAQKELDEYYEALFKELEDKKTAYLEESENKRKNKEIELDIENEEDPLVKLEKEKEYFELQLEQEYAYLEAKREMYAEDTEERLKVEEEYKDKKIKIENEILKNEKETEKEKLRIAKIIEDGKKTIRDNALNAVVRDFQLLAKIDEDNKALQATAILAENAVGVTKQIISTQEANAKVQSKYAGIPFAGAGLASAEIAFNNVNLGVGIGASVLATTEALSALGQGGSPSSGSNTDSQVAPPSFNIVEGTQQSQLNETVETQNATPVKAYVVSTEITNEQALNQKIKSNASL